MEGYLNVIQKRLQDLVQISIKERKEHGIGCLFMDFSNANKLDCRYVALHNELFPRSVFEKYRDRITSVPTSIIFLFIYDSSDETMVEIDLDKNSTFHKVEQETKNPTETILENDNSENTENTNIKNNNLDNNNQTNSVAE